MWSILTCVVVLICASGQTLPETSARRDIGVRLYPSAPLDDHDIGIAGDVLVATLSPVVDVRWHVCASRAVRWERSCDRQLDRTLIGIRFVDGPGGVSADVLGTAAIDAGDQSVMATVYVDHVRASARRAGVDAAELLGHVAAHEVAHLILGRGSHAPGGLMRRVLVPSDLRLAGRAFWALAPVQARAFMAAVGRRHVVPRHGREQASDGGE